MTKRRPFLVPVMTLLLPGLILFAPRIAAEPLAPAPMAQGGAYTAVGGDMWSTLWNPAGLASAKRREIALTQQMAPGGFHGAGGFARPVGRQSGFGLLASLRSPDLFVANADREYALDLGLGWAPFPVIALGGGASFTGLESHLGPPLGSSEFHSALEIRGGLQVRPGARLPHFGLVLSHWESLFPKAGSMRRLDLGMAWVPPRLGPGMTWRLAADARFQDEGPEPRSVRLGTEWRLLEVFALRAGTIVSENDRVLRGRFTLGIGLDFETVAVDYTFLEAREPAPRTHQLGLSVRYGGGR